MSELLYTITNLVLIHGCDIAYFLMTRKCYPFLGITEHSLEK